MWYNYIEIYGKRGHRLMDKAKLAFKYIYTRLLAVLFVLLLILSAFFASMKTSNIYFVLNDALKARLDIIILGTEVEEKSGFFSYDYLNSQEYAQLRSKYSLYIISNYGHKFEYSNLFVWPWQKQKTVTVKEAVYAINGEFDTTQMTKAEAMAMGVYNIPQWQHSIYRVRLKYENGTWVIDRVVRRGDYDYEAPKTPSLNEDEIAALRTPTPPPTPTPDASGVTGERPATISSAIRNDKINLREGPATEYKILEVLDNGAKVIVLEESDGWYLVKTQSGKTGYVSGYYIQFD